MRKNIFLGKSMGFKRKIVQIVKSSDLVIEILDARDPEGTRNIELENFVESCRKKLLVVINKTDLVKNNRFKENANVCTISSKDRSSYKVLKNFIIKNLPFTPAKVAIVGYPNVGKSTIINLLKGHKSASVAPIPGHTKGVQWIRVDENILLLDSPGIVPSYEIDEVSMAEKGAMEADQLKNPEYAALVIIEKLLKKSPYELEKHYDIKISKSDTPEKILELIAIRRGRLVKGKEPDIGESSKLIIRDRYKGKI